MAEAVKYQDSGCNLSYTLGADADAGMVFQMPDGRAAVIPTEGDSGDVSGAVMDGVWLVAKTSSDSQVWLNGAPLWWDHSANKATCVPQYADRDFYLGTAVGDATASATTGYVNLNNRPTYIVNATGSNVIGGTGGDTVIVLTAGTPYLHNRGGMLEAAFSATAEAQKVDWLSRRSFPIAANWIVEGTFEVSTSPDNAAVDIDIGVASGTHATDFESVAEFAAVHLDGNDNNIDVHSDDGTTDVTITDTTIDWTAGTPVSFAIDGRDHTDIKFYINGARVSSGTTFTLTAGTGPIKAIFHMEKTSDDSPGIVQIDSLTVRITE